MKMKGKRINVCTSECARVHKRERDGERYCRNRNVVYDIREWVSEVHGACFRSTQSRHLHPIAIGKTVQENWHVRCCLRYKVSTAVVGVNSSFSLYGWVSLRISESLIKCYIYNASAVNEGNDGRRFYIYYYYCFCCYYYYHHHLPRTLPIRH